MNEDREAMSELERLRDEVLLDDEYLAWREGLRHECRKRLGPPMREDYPLFREGLRRECLSNLTLLRRKRRVTRLAVLAAGIAAALLLALLWPKVAPPSHRLPQKSASSSLIVRTRPLADRFRPTPARMITVHTRTHHFEMKRCTACIIRTRPEIEDSKLTDSELLAMFHPLPCAIIHSGSDTARLHFLNAEDSRLFSNKLLRVPPK